MHRRTLFLSPDGDPAPVQKRVTSAETFIARYGTAEAAVAVLLQDLDASERTATAHARALEDAKTKIPGADKVVLPKADADELAAYRALNLAPAKITEALTERDTLKGTVARGESEKSYRAVAKAEGLDEEAFVAFALREQLPTELRDVTMQEKGRSVTRKAAFIRKPGDDKAPFVAAAEYVGALPAHEQRALKPTAPTQPTGIEYPAQRPTPVTGTTGDPTGDYIARRNAPKTAPAGAAA